MQRTAIGVGIVTRGVAGIAVGVVAGMTIRVAALPVVVPLVWPVAVSAVWPVNAGMDMTLLPVRIVEHVPEHVQCRYPVPEQQGDAQQNVGGQRAHDYTL